ncbi:MAG: hypothetical protein Athens071424_184 [Parcubacteria group bacterium Athens0714_24]|nr:MAG: hypothetical protein Athens071424_184 [Parcubacteria group bacterium Athens0714_24]
MINSLKITKTDINLFAAAVTISLMIFSGIYTQFVGAETEGLSVTVAQTSTFSVDTNNFSGDLTPGTPKYATSTISVLTNTTGGWYVELYGVDRATGNTTMDLSGYDSVGLTDDTEWIPGSATTTSSSQPATQLTSGEDVLSFRVMSASGTPRFLSTTWWGTVDGWPGVGTTLWAGFASSTATNLKIGQISSGDYSSGTALNTVQYYLDVPAGQQTGTYEGNLMYTLVTP